MNAEKSLSSRLSRRNISVAGSAAHSVIAFILMVSACSSESLSPAKLSQGTSRDMSQRTLSNALKSSGYSIVEELIWGSRWVKVIALSGFTARVFTWMHPIRHKWEFLDSVAIVRPVVAGDRPTLFARREYTPREPAARTVDAPATEQSSRLGRGRWRMAILRAGCHCDISNV